MIVRKKMCLNCKKHSQEINYCYKYNVPRNGILDPMHFGCFKEKKKEKKEDRIKYEERRQRIIKIFEAK